jgi:hypothetical protein
MSFRGIERSSEQTGYTCFRCATRLLRAGVSVLEQTH